MSSGADMFAAFRRLAESLRRSIGEAPASVAQDTGRSVTTSSFRAFQSYMRATELSERGGMRKEALSLARQAVEADPTFAAAWIWVAWMLNNGDSRQEALEAARVAASLVNSVTDWERHWILGSYHHLRGENGKALIEYRALLELRPDHFWAVNNLSSIPELAGLPDTRRYARTLSELRPDHLPSVVMALRTQLHAGHSPAEVVDLWTRGMTLVTPEVRDGGGGNRFATLVLFPAYSKLSAGDLPAASQDLEAALADPRIGNGAGRESLLRGAGLLRLAMGQPAAAIRVVEGSNGDVRARLVGAVANYCAGNIDGARHALAGVAIDRSVDLPLTGRRTGVFSDGRMAIWFMTRVGLLDHAAASLLKMQESLPPDTYWPMAARGDLALARGRADEAIEQLQAAMPHLQSWAGGSFYRASLTLADALVEKGRLDEAAATLESALSRFIAKDPYWADAELAAVMIRARLAAIWRRLGRTSDAARIDAELQRTLAIAEPAFVSRIRDLAEGGLATASRYLASGSWTR
jgi:tetratricopeptide (TPR) repeat protein